MFYNKNMNFAFHKSKLRAGKRTYFFEVKVAKTENLYLEITERKNKKILHLPKGIF
jgi:hypothetical protein